MIGLLTGILGHIMLFCYGLAKNYGGAIILFSFISKIILLPISIMVQKNSIKVVKMQPELNYIKASNFMDKDRIGEEQLELYKKYKYHPMLGLIPMLVQLLLLMGVIDVIYKPLKHIYHLPADLLANVIEKFSALSGINAEVGSIQILIVDAIQKGEFIEELSSILGSDMVKSIQGFSTSFLGINLAEIPKEAGGVLVLIPLLAGVCAWLLCFVQDRFNVLQSEQGVGNKIFTTLFSVGLSLYLGFFVPAGVGIYWMFSNLFSIPQLMFLNCIINPKKYINYEELEASKKELDKVKRYAKKKQKWYVKNPYKDMEKESYRRFLKYENKQIVFYSERSGFYKYFKGIIEVLLKETDVVIHYVTSDPQDAIFAKSSEQLQTYYISDMKLITFMMKMDADIVVMTMPDLEKYQIKRSYVRKDIEYIYLHHAINSVNLTLRTGALDYFDTVFAHSGYCIDEIREIEKLHQTKEKTIVEYGYSLLDELIEQYNANPHNKKERETVLIAPSWQKDNIMDSCIEDILNNLIGKGYQIIVRPHPQYVRYAEDYLNYLQNKYGTDDGEVIIEQDFSSNETIYSADVLITDWSSISYEYSFSTLKPTLYINTPMKVMNPEYDKIECKPYDITIRDKIGKELNMDEINQCGNIVEEFIKNKNDYQMRLKEIREQSVFNIGKSAEVGAAYIIERLKKIEQDKKNEMEWET